MSPVGTERKLRVKDAPGTGPAYMALDLDGDSVRVGWPEGCGSGRLFKAEKLRDVIDYLDDFGEIWIKMNDSRSDPFVARVVEGRLFAGSYINVARPNVDWQDAKDTLESYLSMINEKKGTKVVQ